MPSDVSRPRVLIVDDEPEVLRVHARALVRSSHAVETATDGESALRLMKAAPFDVILSDIDMPGMSGMQLLERVRALDLDVPVILITGKPSMETAIRAVEHGALRYLTKPIELEELHRVIDEAVKLHRIAKVKRQAMELSGAAERFVGDQAGLAASFARALDSMFMVYQPIVSWSKRSVFGHEALLRSREPNLPHPGAILDAAERLGKLHELGRRIREAATVPFGADNPDGLLFLNLHPNDLLDEHLYRATTSVGALANRIVLEITERASLHSTPDVAQRISALRDLGFRIAIDDLGAGYSGLESFALLAPHVVKLDMSLVRDIHRQPMKQKIVRTMVTMCRDLSIEVVAEGIETGEERDELVRAGCDLMQGYLFARPGPGLVLPAF